MIDIPALSVRQPWASAIVQHGKDVENRSRQFKYRGPLLIHAATHFDGHALLDPRIKPLGFIRATMPIGQLIGFVVLVDCIRDSDSRWAEPGSWHIILRNPGRFLRPIPYRGQLNLFRVSRAVLADQWPSSLDRQRTLPLEPVTK